MSEVLTPADIVYRLENRLSRPSRNGVIFNPSSKKSYIGDARDFLGYLATRELDLASATTEIVYDYISRLTRRKGTALRRLATIKKLRGIVPFQFDRKIVLSRLELDAPKKVVIDESYFLEVLERLKTHKPPEQYSNARNVAAASAFFRTGALLEQVCSLNENDVRVEGNGNVVVRIKFKNRRPAVYQVTGLEAEELGAYQEKLLSFKRHSGTVKIEDAFLLNNFGRRITGRGLRRRIIEGSMADNHAPITPRMLRNSYIERRRENGASRSDIAEELMTIRI